MGWASPRARAWSPSSPTRRGWRLSAPYRLYRSPGFSAGRRVLRRSFLRHRRQGDGPPFASAVHQQPVGRRGAAAARVVIGEIRLGGGPVVEHGLYDAPRLLDHVGAHEEGLIADHDVVQQRLVADVLLLGEP